MRQITKPALLTPSLCLIDLEANRLARSFLMLDQLPIIVPPSTQRHHPPCEEYCTMGWFLAELSRHFEGSGTAEIVKFEVGDHCATGVN